METSRPAPAEEEVPPVEESREPRSLSPPATAERPRRARRATPPSEPGERPAPNEPTRASPPLHDWDQLRREAIAQMLEQPEGHYSTFSADDALPRPSPAREPVPSGEVFSPNDAPHRTLLAPGREHTRFGRRLADFCHALTGGAGVSLLGFSLFSVCAESGGRSDLFDALKPDYLKMHPECSDDLPPEAIPPPVGRCRLVPSSGPSEPQ
jgi:hypothetical protein